MNISKVGFSSCPAFFALFSPLANKEHDDRFDFSGHCTTELDKQCFAGEENRLPFTDDCKFAIKQMIALYGTLKLNEFIAMILSESHRHLPIEFINAAYSYYMAVVHKKNIDIALVNTLGYIASWPLPDGNIIAELAQKTRAMIADYLGEDYLHQFMGGSDNEFSQNFFIGLAILAVISRCWLSESPAPERRSLQFPTFLAGIILRVSSYWQHLEYMTRPAQE